MDWSVLVSLAALAVTALTVWIGYKDRGSVHRQAIYQKQIEAYSAVFRALWIFWRSASAALKVYSGVLPLKPAELRKIHAEVKTQFDDAHSTYLMNTVFLPEPVATEFSRAFSAWSASARSDFPPTDAATVLVNFTTACFKAVHQAQVALGIEPLSEEILSVVGHNPATKIGRR